MGDVKLLLDEHYPPSLAERLTQAGIDTTSVAASELRGHDDMTVLRHAAAEGRIVVTEDVTTFPDAMALVPNHAGVIFCDHTRFPRTAATLGRLELALTQFASCPPAGAQLTGFVWWLSPAGS